jgi:hypothetical protein
VTLNLLRGVRSRAGGVKIQARTTRTSDLAGAEGDAVGLELRHIRLVTRAREDIDLVAPLDVGEPAVRQYPAPLCL